MLCATAKLQRPVRRRARAGATILVIEDERFVRDITCEILRDAGYRVLHAESAAVARTIFRRGGNEIQLLLCDAVLPDSSGAALSQALRQQAPELKVILASGYPRPGLREGGGAWPENEFLAKPYGAGPLLSKVKIVLQSAAEPNQPRGR